MPNDAVKVTVLNLCPQSHWRRCRQQREYRHRLQYLHQNWRAVVKVKHNCNRRTGNGLFVCLDSCVALVSQIQAAVKMWLARRKYLARLAYFRRHVRDTPASGIMMSVCARVFSSVFYFSVRSEL